jgi:hypothetical protein
MSQVYSTDTFFGEYESFLRKEIGKGLDGLKKMIHDIEGCCTTRIMNVDMLRPAEKGSIVKIEDILEIDSKTRGQIVSCFLYNDALYRLEAAHLMMCIGLFSIAYTNLRTCIEFLQTAFIVERLDEQAKKFLNKSDVDLSVIDKLLINREYSKHLQDLKKLYNDLGVHRSIRAVQLTSIFGPNRFHKYVTESIKTPTPFQLPEGFIDVAKECIWHGERVGIMFSWLESIKPKSA